MTERNGSKNVSLPPPKGLVSERPGSRVTFTGSFDGKIKFGGKIKFDTNRVVEIMFDQTQVVEIKVDPNPVRDVVANAQPPELAQPDADQKEEEKFVAAFSVLKEWVSDVGPHLSDGQIAAMISYDQIAALISDDQGAAMISGHDLQRRLEMALHIMLCADCAIREHAIRNARYGH